MTSIKSKSYSCVSYFIAEVMCPSLPAAPANGYYTCATNSYPFGTICHANCNDGFSLLHSSYAQCKADKTWGISTVATCIGISYKY